MSKEVVRLRRKVVDRSLHAPGKTSEAHRRAAFDNRNVPEGPCKLLDKVAKNARQVTDEDIAAAKKSGLSDDEVFELVVCAALGQATRQIDSALEALEKAKA